MTKARRWILILSLTLGVALTLAACGQNDDAAAAKPPSVGEAMSKVGEPAGASFEAALLDAARGYRAFGCVDDLLRFAPGLCRRPPTPMIRESRSADTKSHGRKLYWLFAHDRNAYLKSREGGAQPVGQVLVKEAWTSVKVQRLHIGNDGETGKPSWIKPTGWKPDNAGFAREPSYLLHKEGKAFHAKEKESLYVMMKLDPQTAGTDEGWIYGTITPDGKKVTSVGRVASCMGCHKKAPNDRMFGLDVN